MIRSDRHPSPHDLLLLFALLFTLSTLWSLGRVALFKSDIEVSQFGSMFFLPSNTPGSPESMVLNTIQRDQKRGLVDAGNFMVVTDSSQVIGFKALHEPKLDDAQYPYTSSFGLQYRLAKPFYALGSWGAYLAMTLMVIAASCACLVTLCLWAGSLAGRSGAIMLGGYFAASPMFLDKIASVYWLLPFFFLPIVIAAIGWPRLRGSRGGCIVFFLAEAVAVFLKCLSGYEFLAPLVAAPALYIMVDELQRAPDRHWQALIRNCLPGALIMLASGTAGFASACGLHILQGDTLLPGRGLDVLLVPAAYSVTGDGDGVRIHAGGLKELLTGLVKSFALRNLHLNIAMWGALIIGMLRLNRKCGGASSAWQALGAKGQALAITLPFAVLALLSWHVLAMNHALDHNHVVWFMVQLVLAPILIPLTALIWQSWQSAP